MLYAIADGLNLNLEGQRVNIILQTLQNHLEMKIDQGKRVVILVDEAHAMPLETMEGALVPIKYQAGAKPNAVQAESLMAIINTPAGQTANPVTDAGLNHLGAPDFVTVCRDEGVERHVLRFKRRDS